MVGNILIVDDEEQLRKLLTRIISLEGFKVVQASTLKAAMEVLSSQPIDVVLCDVRLPDGNGVDFVKTIKKNFPSLETILLTAYGNIADGVQSIKNGAFDYITKPLIPEEVINVMDILQQQQVKKVGLLAKPK